MTDRTDDYHCEKCGKYLFSHYDNPFHSDKPKRPHLCKKHKKTKRMNGGKK